MAKKTQKKKKGGSILKWIGLVLGTMVLIGATTFAILCVYGVHYVQDVIMPEVENSNTKLVSSNTDLSGILYYYDRNADSYQTMQVLDAEENRVWVSYEDIPEQLVKATIAIEDKRFMTHHGVDWKRTGAAIVYMMTGQQVQGGSTITQQLIKNLTRQDEVTVRRKVMEIFEALAFEKKNTKEDIIEWYLNEIYLGHGCYGVVTASQKYFNKNLSELSLAQCASLISITNNPSLYDPYTKPENNLKRRNLTLDLMCEQGYIDQKTCDAAKAEELGCTYGVSQTQDGSTAQDEYYSWYTDAVVHSVLADLQEQYGYDAKIASQLLCTGGLKIFTCFDPAIQASVDAIYTDVSNVAGYDSRDGQQLQSGISVVDNETGAVVAVAGAIGEKVGNRIWSYATDTIRQSGSSIKPLSAYAQALEKGMILPNTIVEDSPFGKVNGKKWPKNSHGGYQGKMDIMTAVAESTNTVAVKVVDMVGLQDSFDFLTQDFQLKTIVDDYVTKSGKRYSDIGLGQLGLGGLTRGVSTMQMAAAYATFPREGTYIAPYLYTVVLDAEGKIILASDTADVSQTCYSVQKNGDEVVAVNGNVAAGQQAILSERTCFYMTEMMENVVNYGTGASAALENMHAAGKTGTTDDDYDRWFVGYTPYYTAAVWTGYDRAKSIQCVVNPAVVLWHDVMTKIHQGLPDQEFDSSLINGATQVTYCTKTGNIATKGCSSTQTALFLPGDEPTVVCTMHGSRKKVILPQAAETKKPAAQKQETTQKTETAQKQESTEKPEQTEQKTEAPEASKPEPKPEQPEKNDSNENGGEPAQQDAGDENE